MNKSTGKTGYTLSKETSLYLDALRQLNAAYGAIYDAVDSHLEGVDSVMDREIVPSFTALQEAVLRLMGGRITNNLLEYEGESKVMI